MISTSLQIATTKFRVWLRPDGVVQFDWEPGFAIDGAVVELDLAPAVQHREA